MLNLCSKLGFYLLQVLIKSVAAFGKKALASKETVGPGWQAIETRGYLLIEVN